MKHGKVGYAIIGTGAGSASNGQSVKLLPEAELIAAIDLDEARGEAFRSKFECVRSYNTLDECLQDDRVDVVIVCTPGASHAELTIRAAQAGKHVLVEKPIDIDPANITRMIEACREAKVKLGSIYQRRMQDIPLQAKNMIDEGVFGRMVLSDAYLKYYRDQAYYDKAPWRAKRSEGGGALINLGVHGIDLIQWLNGGVKSVMAKAMRLERDIEVEDTAIALIDYNNGARGVIELCTLIYPDQNSNFQLHGANGSIRFDDLGMISCERLSGKLNPADWKPSYPVPDTAVISLGHYRIIWDMTRAIMEDREPCITGAEARKAVDIIAAIHQSSETGREIALRDILQ